MEKYFIISDKYGKMFIVQMIKEDIFCIYKGIKLMSKCIFYWKDK